MLVEIIELVRNVLGVGPIKPGKCPAVWAVMIRSGQPQALVFFWEYGFPQGRKAGIVGISKQIFESKDERIIRAFLFGLFSSDGCFSFQVNRGPRVEIQVKSKALRDGFVDLAGNIGFKFRIYVIFRLTAKTNSLYRLLIRLGRNKLFDGWKKSAQSKIRIICGLWSGKC